MKRILFCVGIYRKRLETWNLAALALLQIFYLRLRLVQAQWSLAPVKKICAAALPNFKFLSVFGIYLKRLETWNLAALALLQIFYLRLRLVQAQWSLAPVKKICAAALPNFKFLSVFGIAFLFPLFSAQEPKVLLGVDIFFKEKKFTEWKGKRVGLITNQTGVDRQMCTTIDLFLQNAPDVKIAALFSPEHGLFGSSYAEEEVGEKKGPQGIPLYSLHGKTRRPTAQMLKDIDVLIYDIQDIGSRSYTYTTTLFYAMEEAAKLHIPVIVLDRPNPINGQLIEGPMVKDSWRSFIGYLNVPYCHGMTVGELATYFNEEYKVGCTLEVIPMQGWQRWMHFIDTGLTWIPTSPNIPEADTPLFYATTGLIGQLGLVSIGIGYTLPFKILGAPWIKAAELASKMNEQHLPGVYFLPFFFRPFYGLFKGKDCEGVLIKITDPHVYKPVSVQYMLLGILSLLYPKQMQTRLDALESVKKEFFCKASGNEEMFTLLCKEKYVAWKLITFQKEEREQFRKTRQKYLLYP